MTQFIKFLLVGVLNTSLGYSIIFACMYLLGLSAVFSNVIGYLIGLVASYALHGSFTFNSRSRWNSEGVRFLLVFLLSYFANLGVLLLLINFFGTHEGVAQLVAGVIYVLTSFVLNKYYVFRRPPAERGSCLEKTSGNTKENIGGLR